MILWTRGSAEHIFISFQSFIHLILLQQLRLCGRGLASHWFHLSQSWMRSQKTKQNKTKGQKNGLQVAPAQTDTTDWSFYRYEWAAVYLAHCCVCSKTGLNDVLWSKSNRRGWISRILAQDMKLSIGQRTDFKGELKTSTQTATCFKKYDTVSSAVFRERIQRKAHQRYGKLSNAMKLRVKFHDCLQNWQPGTILTQMPDLQWSWK